MLTAAEFDAIRQFDTCSISNAIETFDLRIRNEGFTRPGLRCLFPEVAPMLGYAVTAHIRTANPPTSGLLYHDRTDWWDFIQDSARPGVAVFQDIDENRGIGAVVGEVHVSILRALQCIGVVTDGAVRDLPGIRSMRFPLFARHISVSHAFAHIIDFGRPCDIFGLRINTGDLLYGDCHGVLCIPQEIAPQVAARAAELRAGERTIIDLCRSPEFSIDRLRQAVKDLS